MFKLVTLTLSVQYLLAIYVTNTTTTTTTTLVILLTISFYKDNWKYWTTRLHAKISPLAKCETAGCVLLILLIQSHACTLPSQLSTSSITGYWLLARWDVTGSGRDGGVLLADLHQSGSPEGRPQMAPSVLEPLQEASKEGREYANQTKLKKKSKVACRSPQTDGPASSHTEDL